MLNRRLIKPILFVLMLLIILSTFFYKNIKDHGLLNLNGRPWGEIINSIKTEKVGVHEKQISFTGAGLGSFAYIWAQEHKSIFKQAHNEYLDVFWQLGIFGLLLFLASIWWCIKNALTFNLVISGDMLPVFTSFVCTLLIAFGTFIWQVSPHDFISVYLVGLLHNEQLLKGEANV